MTLPRGALAGTLAALALVWAPVGLGLGGRDMRTPLIETAAYLALLTLTVTSRRAKVALVRVVQRFAVNPLVRLLLRLGVNPLGVAILETRGRVSGKLRRTPVGEGRVGSTFWILAEHGNRAGYVRNIRRDPRVRIRMRVGWRRRWVRGVATVLPDDDPLARQRRLIRWHPLRALNAMNVRVLGTDLLTVRVDLLDPLERAGPDPESAPRPLPAVPRAAADAERSPSPGQRNELASRTRTASPANAR